MSGMKTMRKRKGAVPVNGGKWLSLSEAIAECGEDAAHVSRGAIQRACREGQIETRRTSMAPKARFRVRVDSLRSYLRRLAN